MDRFNRPVFTGEELEWRAGGSRKPQASTTIHYGDSSVYVHKGVIGETYRIFPWSEDITSGVDDEVFMPNDRVVSGLIVIALRDLVGARPAAAAEPVPETLLMPVPAEAVPPVQTPPAGVDGALPEAA